MQIEGMPDLVVVAFAGRAGAGKDTAASALQAFRDFVPIGFGDGPKEMIDALSGRTRAAHKAMGHAIRREWQLAGTECREEAGCPALWIDLMKTKVTYAYRRLGWRRFAIPDMRYRAENASMAYWVERRGGVYVSARIVRDGEPIPESDHSSEHDWAHIPVDLELVNRGDRRSFMLEAEAAVMLEVERRRFLRSLA